MVNRNNYEEFFMLYADGELSAADRQAVELFVRENSDLAVELDLFLQTRLPDEQVIYNNKNDLFRFEAQDINAANHEEQFLLYVDNELDAAGREKVERFVLQNPGFQSAFTVLKQTRLPEETIVFADKASLYRKEEKKRPVIYLRWGSMLAAAVMIGLAFAVWTLLPNDRSAIKRLAAGSQAQTASTGSLPLASQTQHAAPLIAAGTNKLVPATTTSAEDKGKGTTQPANSNNISETPSRVENNLVAVNTVNPPVDEKTETVGSAQVSTATGATTGSLADNASTHNVELVKNTDHNTTEDASENIAHPAVYKELDTDDEKKSLYLGSLEINKDKLRGFFRKAGSIFRSKARQEEDDNKTESAPRSRSLN